jgi:hypothetical protein
MGLHRVAAGHAWLRSAGRIHSIPRFDGRQELNRGPCGRVSIKIAGGGTPTLTDVLTTLGASPTLALESGSTAIVPGKPEASENPIECRGHPAGSPWRPRA